jgi:hypothetical protein
MIMRGVFYGHKQALTPNIDKLDASGIRFVNAQTNVLVCQPARNFSVHVAFTLTTQGFWMDRSYQTNCLKNNKTNEVFSREWI